jgi:hypothetical protein
LNTSLLMKILWTIILTLFVAFLDEFTWQSGRTFVWKTGLDMFVNPVQKTKQKHKTSSFFLSNSASVILDSWKTSKKVLLF